MSSSAAEAYFRDEFEEELGQLGGDLLAKYQPVLKAYREIIIPFERKRVNEHQSIIFENSSLEQNKLELMEKLERYKAECEKLEHALELQRSKISQYERQLEDMESINNDNLSVIESLRIRNDDYKAALDHKNASISQLEKVLPSRCRTKQCSFRNSRTRTRSSIWCSPTA
jgi:chromosome condensin MukBEF ATPase and DNA-binding subunit MukB